MKEIALKEFQEEITSNQTIGRKGGFPALILHSDQTITKVWVKRPRLSVLTPWRHYSSRFIRAGKRLAKAGILVPEIIDHRKVSGTMARVVRYTHLEGQSIRDWLRDDPTKVDVTQLARFFLHLHEKGIAFRAIHFGNIIQQADGSFGLIDFSNVKFRKRQLGLIERAKNLATPLRYDEDAAAYRAAGLPDFVEMYLDQWSPPSQPRTQRQKLKQAVNARLNRK